jgi:hypothetical protein
VKTDALHVVALGQISGHVRNQYGAGVAGARVELYFGSTLIETTYTSTSGLYTFDKQLTLSGAYTVKIVHLPRGYRFGPNPSQKPATYNVGQASPTIVDFTVQKT